jgi:hypothetical protein
VCLHVASSVGRRLQATRRTNREHELCYADGNVSFLPRARVKSLQTFEDESGAPVSSSVCHFPPAHHNFERQPRTVRRLKGPLRAPTFVTTPATTTRALLQTTTPTRKNLTFQRQLLLTHFLNLCWICILSQTTAVVLIKEMTGPNLSRSITVGRRDAPPVFAQAETVLLVTVHLPG